MKTAKIFTTGRSQAVRLPKEFRFQAKEVGIKKVDDVVMLFPKGKGYKNTIRSLSHFTSDFMADRNQPAEPEKRERL